MGVVCRVCGSRYDGSPKFCSECAAPLSSVRLGAQERKTVTAVFCDLVEFTALSESADPEDVDRMLSRYFATARSAIEAYGGVVEKFIGDAVVGVFGVPAEHEDDAERAVRAGLRIVEDAASLTALDGSPLRLRIGVNTGETVVRLDVVPSSGERFLAGDAINTASRIQSVAPVMGVAVGQATYDATQRVFDYADLQPAVVKGKSQPVAVFHAVAYRRRPGTDLGRVHDGPFVGRDVELESLRGVFDATVASSTPRQVTLVGEPGLGKSRLVAELSRYVDTRPEPVTWRQGRCLPYGEGITYWALAEVVKAHAGILDSDRSEQAGEKLEAVLPEDQREWYRQRLLPLLGLATASTAQRGELFAAWTGFLVHLAVQAPTVVVLEDLHWADEPMLAFLEHLAAHAEDVPLLIVGTARPELFEDHATFGSGPRPATRITLSPLSADETTLLVSGLLDAVAVPAEVQATVLARAEGNPLYAGELVRLLKDRGLLVRSGASWSLAADGELPLPSSVRSLIAARIDTLTPVAKLLVADAAVLGRVFWDGAIVDLSGVDAAEVGTCLRELSLRQLIRPVTQTTVAGQQEYEFWHALTRDVAYAQLTRGVRAAKHLAAARWMELVSSGRIEDVSDVLAHHATTALDAAVAAEDHDRAAIAKAESFRYLTLAGERAHGLDTAAALTHLERALELAPDDGAEVARARLRLSWLQFEAGRYQEAVAGFEQTIDEARDAGDPRTQARALLGLSRLLGRMGELERRRPMPAEAYALLEALSPTSVHVEALTELCVDHAMSGRPEAAVVYAGRAQDLAAELGMAAPHRALAFRGVARSELGDSRWPADYRQAIELAEADGAGVAVGTYSHNLACATVLWEGPRAALEVFEESVRYARSRGLGTVADMSLVLLPDLLFDSGQPRRARDEWATLAERLEASDSDFDLMPVRLFELRAAAVSGRTSSVRGSLDWVESRAGAFGGAEVRVPALTWIACSVARTEPDRASSLLSELRSAGPMAAVETLAPVVPVAVRQAIALGCSDLAEELLALVDDGHPWTAWVRTAGRAAVAEARGDLGAAAEGYAGAAAGWHEFGHVLEEAYAHLGLGRCMVAAGTENAATSALLRARELFEMFEAGPALREIDLLLDASAVGA